MNGLWNVEDVEDVDDDSSNRISVCSFFSLFFLPPLVWAREGQFQQQDVVCKVLVKRMQIV